MQPAASAASVTICLKSWYYPCSAPPHSVLCKPCQSWTILIYIKIITISNNKFPKILIRENCERIQLEKADRTELSECHKLVDALKAELAEVKAELSSLKNARSSLFSSPGAESQGDLEIMQKKIEELAKHSKEASTWNFILYRIII